MMESWMWLPFLVERDAFHNLGENSPDIDATGDHARQVLELVDTHMADIARLEKKDRTPPDCLSEYAGYAKIRERS